MQVCTLLQTDNHASTPPLSCVRLLQVGVLSKWLDRSSWFLAHRLFSTYVLEGNSDASKNKSTSFLERCPKLRLTEVFAVVVSE